MKTCPKCSAEHNNKGIFCSRKCANSRNFSYETKLKKSNSAKSSLKVKQANQQNQFGGFKRTKDDSKYGLFECKVCGNNFKKLKSNIKKVTCSHECHLQCRGGLRKNSGIGKSGWFHGMYLNSTYEIAYVYYHIKNNIDIKRCDRFYKYLDSKSGRERKYYPDFIVNGEIIEIKGYKSYNTDDKIKSCNAKLLLKKDLQHIFDFVERDSGIKIKDLYRLYDKKEQCRPS